MLLITAFALDAFDALHRWLARQSAPHQRLFFDLISAPAPPI